MKRKPLIMGNWKMYKTVAEARSFAESLSQRSSALANRIDYAILVPFTCLHVLRVMLPAQVKLGAQNVYPEKEGAFTGEISPSMLVEFGTQYVLAGHSERRTLFGERDDLIGKKVRATLDHGMTPVLCVGENTAEKESGQTVDVVTAQVIAGLAGLNSDEVAKAVIAYEPIWAIGTGKTATAEDAEHIAKEIRELIRQKFSASAADNVRILYGGSVKPNNIAAFVEQSDIDGALVGAASLDAASFAEMAKAVGGVLS